MVIYTLPGPIYSYSVKVNSFDPDTIGFDVKLPGTAKSSAAPTDPTGTATVKLDVTSIKGLSNVRLSITPSDSDLGAARVGPAGLEASGAISGAVVGDSYVLSAEYLPRGESVSISLQFRRRSAAPADATVLLTATELLSPASTQLAI